MAPAVSVLLSIVGVASIASCDPSGPSRPAIFARRFPNAAFACYPGDLTEMEREEILRTMGALPPALLAPPDARFFTDQIVWTSDGLQGPSVRAAAASLTYSFPTDGIEWGLSQIYLTGLNRLNEKFVQLFGTFDVDKGHELVRQGLASWRRYAAVSYQEVSDNNSPEDQVIFRSPFRGDIRIGGTQSGTPNFLAYNAFPSPALVGVGGADMCINTSYFVPQTLSSPTNNFRILRNVVAHEHGHGLGFIHSIPCDNTKLMEPFLSTAFDMVQPDEIRGVQRNYGDRFAGNNSPATAKDFGNLVSPVKHSVIERSLSVNGADGFNGTNEDWFRFSLDGAAVQTLIITVDPVGGTSTQGQQVSGCTGVTANVTATQAGDLAVELRSADGSSVIQVASSGGPGASEMIQIVAPVFGTYTVRVYDVGPNSPANQIVQLYDLTIRIDDSKASPRAIAGLNKIIGAYSNCYFFGNINSYATEPGAGLSNFEWDLDGDGVFGSSLRADTRIAYVSNGDYPVTLRVTDTNGLTDTDTIHVLVFAAATIVNGIAPNQGRRGASVPVTISGGNLRRLQAANVTVMGSGVTVTGNAVSNGLGTSVSGLSFVVAANAPLGPRDVYIANQDGAYLAHGAFTVIPRFQLNFDSRALNPPADGQ